MRNSQKSLVFPILVAVIVIVIVVGGIFIYKNSKPNVSVLSDSQKVTTPVLCKDFVALSDFVLKNIQQPDSQNVMQANLYGITSFRWKRKASEPFITYPTVNGIKAYYGDDNTYRTIDYTVSAIKKDSNILNQKLNTEVKKLGLFANSLNTLQFQSFSTQNATQTFGFEKDGSLYSIALTVYSGGHQVQPHGIVRIACSKSLDNYDKVYSALKLKDDSSVKDPYNNDYIEIADVSPDNTVYEIFGSSNQPKDMNYYYFNDNKLRLVSSSSSPALCAKLESQKVGQGMGCVNNSGTFGMVNYIDSIH